MRWKLNKLVRHKIPEEIKNEKRKPIVGKVHGEKLEHRLHEKLHEEVAEFMESKSEEELADIMEVVLALAFSKGMTPEELENLRVAKAESKGKFDHGVVLYDVHDIDEEMDEER